MVKEMDTISGTRMVAMRFNELAKKEKWFEIQDELFADNVRSVEPSHSMYFKDEEGKALVRKKGEEWVARVKSANKLSTSEPIVAGSHFAVSRCVDIDVEGHGHVIINELMLYEVKDGKIVLEQFFY
ncbi:SnoaL-like domain-containing protein [Chryseolinea sp. T2]|uniref:SnoaL-like domain-containing protein n=1 Tax=Chryseolinea sp. T2 TaxID=3129255 RepID=UPI003077864E